MCMIGDPQAPVGSMFQAHGLGLESEMMMFSVHFHSGHCCCCTLVFFRRASASVTVIGVPEDLTYSCRLSVRCSRIRAMRKSTSYVSVLLSYVPSS